MRSIQISTPVFAAIWAGRLEGEDSEDEILTRMLKLKLPEQASAPDARRERAQPLGFHDERYGFHVEEGFEVFRRFKGTEYRAKASRWKWLFEGDGRYYDSLADLSRRIGAGSENAWAGWLCRPKGGSPVAVGSLRAAHTVQKRGVSDATMEDIKTIFDRASEDAAAPT